MPTPLHAIRIDDELWSASLAKAKDAGYSLSEVIRQLLELWRSGLIVL